MSAKNRTVTKVVLKRQNLLSLAVSLQYRTVTKVVLKRESDEIYINWTI